MKNVLLVEPDRMQASAIAQALSSKDVTVQVAQGAQAAISSADNVKPDLVILELVLPTHNGVEFLHEFRSYSEWAEIPVIIFSAQQIDDQAMFQKMENVIYMYKPLTSLAGLKNQLEGILFTKSEA